MEFQPTYGQWPLDPFAGSYASTVKEKKQVSASAPHRATRSGASRTTKKSRPAKRRR